MNKTVKRVVIGEFAYNGWCAWYDGDSPETDELIVENIWTKARCIAAVKHKCGKDVEIVENQ